jgi:NADH-quinone oxidoreductase subunit C
MMKEDKSTLLVKKIKGRFGDAIVSTVVDRGEVTHVVKKDALLDVCRYLKSDSELSMNYLVDVFGVDRLAERPRFEVVYQFLSIPKKLRVRLKVRIEDGETVPTLTGLWGGANWPERETYDMFGIVFDGHPNLRRIYLADDWVGFPLRKDYPLRGYKDEHNPFGEEKKRD